MYISHLNSVEKKVLSGDALKGVSKQTVIGPAEGWKDHVMRFFTLAPGGHTPRHSHPWPHINYVVDGEGTLFHKGETSPISKGSVAYLPPDTEHQFRNTGDRDLVFMCIVPKEGDA